MAKLEQNSNLTSASKESPPIPLHLPLASRVPLIPYLPRHGLSPNNQADVNVTPKSKPLSASPTIPHLTLTYATSLDAQLSLYPGVQTLLSGPESKAMTHFLRAHHDAILIGVGTAVCDDPSLNSRFCHHCLFGAQEGDGVGENVESEMHSVPVGLVHQPIPVILDPRGRWTVGAQSRVLALARAGYGRAPLWVVDEEFVSGIAEGSRDLLGAVGGAVVGIKGLMMCDRRGEEGGGDGEGMGTVGVNWGALLQALGQRHIRSIMVEGGGKVIRDLLTGQNRLVTASVILTMAPVWLGKGGVEAVPERGADMRSAVARLEDVKWIPMEQDAVLCGRFDHGSSAP